LSLPTKLPDGLYGEKRKPRLKYAQFLFLGRTDRDPDLEGLTEYYIDWRDDDVYLVLQRQSDNLRLLGEIDKETIAVKCAKRGNDVYRWRVWKRLKFLYDLKDRTIFDPHSTIRKTNALFVTLTYNTKLSTIQNAWKNIGHDFNNWIRNIRKKYGKISYLRCWESSQRGYPHVHLLMVFHNHQFNVLRIAGKYRIPKKDASKKSAFERYWHSFVDVQAVRKLKEGITYVTKYLFKAHAESHTQVLTFALCWLFQKQSFAVSGSFHDIIYTKMKIRCRFVQKDLDGNMVDLRIVWIYIGIFSAEKLGITHNEWWKIIIDKRILSEILT
jgi:hypothetical protein